MSQLKQYLNQLNLNQDFLIHCHLEQAYQEIQAAYARSHQTPEITNAYQELCQLMPQLFFQEPDYLRDVPTIPTGYFSFRQQQEIIMAYEALLKTYPIRPHNSINELEQTKYELFFKIGHSIQKQHEQVKSQLKNDIEAFEHQAIKDWYIHHYRCLMIRLFAKEDLSDFEYRNALVTGDMKPILSPFKLLWPVKWIAAIISTLSLPLQYIKEIPKRYINFFASRFKYYLQLEHLSFSESFFKTLSISGLLLGYCISWCFLISSELPCFFQLATLVVYSDLLELFANPINLCLNPLSQKLNVSTVILGLTCSVMIGLLFWNLAFLDAVEILGIVYLGLSTLQTMFNISELDRKLIYGFSVLLPIIAYNFLFCTLAQSLIIPNMATLWNLTEFSYRLLTQAFDYDNAPELKQLKCFLPLKNHEAAPLQIKSCVNTHCKSQRLSSLFFNTPKQQEIFLDTSYYQNR